MSDPAVQAAPGTRGVQRGALVAAVGIGLSTLATVLVVRDLDLARTAEIVAGAQPALLIAGLALIAGQAILRALRWQVLLPHRGDGRRVPLASVAMAMLVGYLGNTVLPARLGELIRAALLGIREAIPVPVALGSAILERALDVFVLALFGVVAATAVSAPGWVGSAAGTAALVGGLGLLTIAGTATVAVRWSGRGHGPHAPGRFPGAHRIARIVGQTVAGGRIVDRPRAVILATLLTIATWVIDTGLIWCVARSIGIDLTPAGAMLVSVVAVLSTAIPTAPGYIGTFELAAVAAVGVSGVTGEAALAFAILAHLIAVLPLSIAGAISLWILGAPSLRGLAATARTRAPAALP